MELGNFRASFKPTAKLRHADNAGEQSRIQHLKADIAEQGPKLPVLPERMEFSSPRTEPDFIWMP